MRTSTRPARSSTLICTLASSLLSPRVRLTASIDTSSPEPAVTMMSPEMLADAEAAVASDLHLAREALGLLRAVVPSLVGARRRQVTQQLFGHQRFGLRQRARNRTRLDSLFLVGDVAKHHFLRRSRSNDARKKAAVVGFDHVRDKGRIDLFRRLENILQNLGREYL